MEEKLTGLGGRRGCLTIVERAFFIIFNCVLVLLLMFQSLGYSTPRDLLFCSHGHLNEGSGFPVSFACNVAHGPNEYISPLGFILDILFYAVLLGLVWFILFSVYHKARYSRATYIIVTALFSFLCILCTLAFLHGGT